MTSDDGEVIFVPIGPVFGWFCAQCGETRLGYDSKESSTNGAEVHAMDAHAPAGGWEEGHRVLSVEWD